MINLHEWLQKEPTDWIEVEDFEAKEAPRAAIAVRRSRTEGPLHAAADQNLGKLSVALRYAFATAKKAVPQKLTLNRVDDVVSTLGAALADVLPNALAQTAADGANAAWGLLPKLKVAEEIGHEFHGNQWTGSNAWRNDPLAHVSDRLYRGTEAGSFDETARMFDQSGVSRGGELGGGIYFTPDYDVARTYGGGPTASFEGGTRAVHEVEWVEKPKPEETAYLEGLNVGPKPARFGDTQEGFGGEARLIDGNGKKLWRGQQMNATDRSAMFDAAQANNIKVMIGLSNSIASNQVSVLDKSAIRLKQTLRLPRNDTPHYEPEKYPRMWPTYRRKSTAPDQPSSPTSRFLAKPAPAVTATSKPVEAWAQKHAAELVKDVTKNTREWLREAVTAHVAGELNDREFFNAINDAIGDAVRAQVIARTESMRAVHAGQHITWNDAVDEGLLSEDAVQEWITTDDKATCPICDALDGEQAPLDGTFDADGDKIDGPPAHPQCRCTVGIVEP